MQWDDIECIAGWERRIKNYFSEQNPECDYSYDFGDDWEHRIVFEQALEGKTGQKYPVCLSGKRACPPEDCGGSWGYEELLAILNDPTHEEHDSMPEWVGGAFDPVAFDPKAVKFDNPKKRWNIAFGKTGL